MSSSISLELSGLQKHHANLSLLQACGTSTIVRLCLDPTLLPSSTLSRNIIVEWTGYAERSQQVLDRDISWNEVPREIVAASVKWLATKNAHDITEEAAIGVMALLLHYLEDGQIVSVLQIGSGGDFAIQIRGGPALQAECSGIRCESEGNKLTDRVRMKTQQVLAKCHAGFVSVTAFSYSLSREVRCCLRYTTRAKI